MERTDTASMEWMCMYAPAMMDLLVQKDDVKSILMSVRESTAVAMEDALMELTLFTVIVIPATWVHCVKFPQVY